MRQPQANPAAAAARLEWRYGPGALARVGRLPTFILGLALRDRGWRVTFLGPDTPIKTLAAAADQLAPNVVVLSSLTREPLAAAVTEIAQIAASRPVFLAGPGADAELAERSRARLLAGNPSEAADEVLA